MHLIYIIFKQTFKRRQFLLGLAHNLPSESPLSKDWPSAPRYAKEASNMLKKVYHKWRVSNNKQRISTD